MAETPRSEEIGLHNIKPKPGSRRPRKRVGRGEGSGTGKTSGRGHKGAGARSGSKRKVAYEGGQNPIHMRMRKLRGPHMKKSMPFENFRTAPSRSTSPTSSSASTPAPRSPRDAPREGPGEALGSGQGPRPRRALQEAHRPRARLQRRRPGEDRGGGRHLRADLDPSEPDAAEDAQRWLRRRILNAFRVADIRKKIAFTAAMLALYRLGAYIPAPGVNINAVKEIQNNFAGSNILGFLNLFSGGSLSRLSLFALGIMPYITASIILQLLTVVVPSLEKLQKEGEVGQQKITQYTRYLTVGLAFAQSLGYVFLFRTFKATRPASAWSASSPSPTSS